MSDARRRRSWSWLWVILGGLYFFVPLGATFLFSLKGRRDVLSFVAYAHVLSDPQFLRTFTFSLEMAAVTIIAGLALMIPTAIWVHLRLPRARPLIEIFALLPFVIPPIVLVFGLIRMYSRPPFALVTSPVLLIAGYIVLSFPYVFRAVDAGLRAIDLRMLTEAAQSLGARWGTTLFRVVLPNIRVSLLSAAFLTFSIVVGELTLAVMLAWPAFGPYMALVGRDLAYEPAALAIISFLLTWGALVVMQLLTRGRRGPGVTPGGVHEDLGELRMAFVELVDIVKRFGRHLAVDSFSLRIEEGEFVSFLGGSGCGKTTTLRMIAGFETPTSGSILLKGSAVVPVPPNQRGVGMVFQNYALFPNMTAAQNIGFGLKVAGRHPDERQRRVTEMLALIHMEDFRDRHPHQMSGGQQQRVALARALAVQPSLLLLDEPLSALDAMIRVRLRAEIRAIQRRLAITTIYVTHDQEEALSISDRIVVMKDGRIEQVGTPFEIYNRPATAFVASFIGSSNVLRARVVDAEGGRVTVDGQEIVTARPLPGGKGREVSLQVRPESITLNNGVASNNHLKGTLSNVVFLGAIVRLVITAGRVELFMDTFNNPHLALPALGSPVTVGFAPEACVPLEESTSGAQGAPGLELAAEPSPPSDPATSS